MNQHIPQRALHDQSATEQRDPKHLKGNNSNSWKRRGYGGQRQMLGTAQGHNQDRRG